MKKKCLAMLLAVVMAVSLLPGTVFAAATAPTEQQVYEAMSALKSQYPEGMTWNNNNYYDWRGGIFSRGYGCAGFAFMLSDAAFGNLPARMLTKFEFSDVRVGDILRLNNDTHSVIVLEVNDNGVIITEGNYNNSIHWGRTLTKAEVLAANYMLTRYPLKESTPSTPTQPETPATSFTDVPAAAYYAPAVAWAVKNGVTSGKTSTTFDPSGSCTRGQIVTFLWRAHGKPEPTSTVNPFTDVKSNAYYYKAVLWAVENGITSGTSATTFTPGGICTRRDAITFQWRAAGWPAAAGGIPFTDVASGKYYSTAIAWAAANGIAQGTGAFNPGNFCSRADIVTFLYRELGQ